MDGYNSVSFNKSTFQKFSKKIRKQINNGTCVVWVLNVYYFKSSCKKYKSIQHINTIYIYIYSLRAFASTSQSKIFYIFQHKNLLFIFYILIFQNTCHQIINFILNFIKISIFLIFLKLFLFLHTQQLQFILFLQHRNT